MMKASRNREGGEGNNGMSRREKKKRKRGEESREDLSVHNTPARQRQTFRGQRQGDEIKARRNPKKRGRNITSPPEKLLVMQQEGFFFPPPSLFSYLGCLPCRPQSLVSPLGEQPAVGCQLKSRLPRFSTELKAFMLHYGSGNLDKIQTGRIRG